jgi:hypothetical protein
MSNWTSLSEIKPAESITLLLYGASGKGKTRFLGTAGDDTLIIETGAGLETLLSPDFKAKFKSNPKIAFVEEEIDPKTGIFKSADAFDKVTDLLDLALADPTIKTVAVDDATFLQYFANNKALDINKDTNRSKTIDQARKIGIPLMAIQDFGTQMKIIEWFLATYIPQFKRAGKNFILTAHERLTFEKGDKVGDLATISKITPGFIGQSFPDTVPAFFDWVWRAESVSGGESIKYRFRTVGDEKLIAKTRHAGVFKALDDDCNWQSLIARFHKAYENSTQPKK